MMQTSAKPAYNRARASESSVTGAMETVLKPPVPSWFANRCLKRRCGCRSAISIFTTARLHALHTINLDVATNRVTALIGPSGCGKSTLLRTLNRMHETVRGTAPGG